MIETKMDCLISSLYGMNVKVMIVMSFFIIIIKLKCIRLGVVSGGQAQKQNGLIIFQGKSPAYTLLQV